MTNRIQNFTIVNNEVLLNQNISLKAKGLYAFMCSKPPEWDFNYRGLYSQLVEGEKAIRSAIKELVEAKYLIRIPTTTTRNGHTFADFDWIINPTAEDIKNSTDPLSQNTVKKALNKPKKAKTNAVKNISKLNGGDQVGGSQNGGDIVILDNSNTINSFKKNKQKKPDGNLSAQIIKKLSDPKYQGINKQALLEWVEYKNFKAIAPVTKVLNFLIGFKPDIQQKMIDLSIMNEYKGLFELKQSKSTSYESREQQNQRIIDEAYKEYSDGTFVPNQAPQQDFVIEIETKGEY